MSSLAEGREAYAERRWPDTVGQYTEEDRDAELPAGDLEQLATSIILTGRASEGVDILARAHLKYLADGDYPAAARCAVWTGLNLMLLGEPARSSGWLACARRIVDDLPEPCPCEGLLSVPAGLGALYQVDAAAAKSFGRGRLSYDCQSHRYQQCAYCRRSLLHHWCSLPVRPPREPVRRATRPPTVR